MVHTGQGRCAGLLPALWLLPPPSPASPPQVSLSFLSDVSFIPSLHYRGTGSTAIGQGLSQVQQEQGGASTACGSALDGDVSAGACRMQSLSLCRLFRLSSHVASAAGRSAPGHEASAAGSSSSGSSITKVLPPRPHAPNLRIAAVTRKGWAPGYKSDNQDSALVVTPYLRGGDALFAVMDGHGVEGHHVSGFVRQRLPTCLLNQLLDAGAADGVGPGVSSSASPHSSHTEGVLPGPDPAEAASAGQKGAKGKGAGGKGGDKGAVQGVPRALEQAFVEVDGLLSDSTAIDAVNSGTTVVASLLQGRKLTTAWVGDSRAVLASRSGGINGRWHATDLSSDHKPDCEQERRRILAAGGRVEQTRSSRGKPVGPHRVWLPHADYPGLAMSRAVGDTVARPIGVTCVPEVRSVEIKQGTDAFLLLASDGVWEYLSSGEVAELVGRELDWARAQLRRQQQQQPQAQQDGRGGQQQGARRQQGEQQQGEQLGGGQEGQRQVVVGSGDRGLGRANSKGPGLGRGVTPEMHACSALVAEARDRWIAEYGGQYIDDVTACLVVFED